MSAWIDMPALASSVAPSVAELVGDDASRVSVGPGEPGGGHAVTQAPLDAGGSEASASFNEDEVGEVAIAWVGPGSLRAALGEPLLEGFERGVIERDAAFVVELAERHAQPRAVVAVVDDVAEFEIEEFTDAQAGAAEHGDGDPGELVVEFSGRVHDRGIDVWWQGAWKGIGLPGDVGLEHEPPAWRVGPPPRPDVIEEAAHGKRGVSVGMRSDLSAVVVAAAVVPGGGPGEERFDVSSFQIGDAREVRVVVADELAKDRQGTGELVDRLGSQHGGSHVEIRANGATNLGRGDGRETGLAGRWPALASMLRGELDHACFEEKTTESEQMATPPSPHRFGQPRRRIDCLLEVVEVVNAQCARASTGERDSERQYFAHGNIGRSGTEQHCHQARACRRQRFIRRLIRISIIEKPRPLCVHKSPRPEFGGDAKKAKTGS